MGELVVDVDVDAVGFRVGNRVVSVDVVGFIVELGAACLTVVDNGNTLGIKIHSGGNSVFSKKIEKHKIYNRFFFSYMFEQRKKEILV